MELAETDVGAAYADDGGEERSIGITFAFADQIRDGHKTLTRDLDSSCCRATYFPSLGN